MHYQYISGLRWCGARGTQLLTASYDGSLRLLDVGQVRLLAGEKPDACSGGVEWKGQVTDACIGVRCLL